MSKYELLLDEPQQKESVGGKIGRNIERIIPEIAGHAYGLPGDIAQLGEGAGNWLIEALTGKENVIPQVAGKYIPTSEQLVEGMRQTQRKIPSYQGEYLEPQSNLESSLSEGAKFAGSALGGGALGEIAQVGGLGAKALKGAAKVGAGHTIGDFIGRTLGIDESYLPLFRFAGATGPTIGKTLYGLINPKKLEETASNLYTYAKDNAPEVPFTTKPLQRVFSELEDVSRSKSTDPDVRDFIKKQLERIGEKTLKKEIVSSVSKSGKTTQRLRDTLKLDLPREIDPRELLKLKEDFSHTFKKLSGSKNAPERKIWHSINDAIKETFSANKKKAPEFVKAVEEGNELFNAYYNSWGTYNLLRNKLGIKGSAYASYPAMKLFKMIGIKSLPGTAASLEAANLIKNVVSNPSMRKYYSEMIKGSINNKPAQTISAFKNLNSLMKKEMKPQSNSKYELILE